jgi:hypothetical protein
MKRCVVLILALVPLLCQAQKSTAPVTGRDLKDASAVGKYAGGESKTASREKVAEQCRKATLHATTDGMTISIGTVAYADREFADEAIRIYKTKVFYCIEIRGPGYDPKRVATLSEWLKKTTDVQAISWVPLEEKNPDRR